MAASNTKDCFRECVGKKIKGVLFDALPVGDRHIAIGTKTFVFDDGTGITVTSGGAFWLENATDIGRAIERKRSELEDNRRDIQDVLTAAGAR